MIKHHNQKNALTGLLLASMLWTLSGCVTPTGNDGMLSSSGHVIERSKPEAPSWTAFGAGQMHETDTILSYVELGTRLRDLPLGLKTTQLGAIDASRNALAAVVREKLGDDRDRLSSADHAEFERHVVAASADFHGRHAKVSDIYFEKLAADDGDIPEYFNAFVLVTMPRDKLSDLFEGLGRRLSGSQESSLRQLGQSLLSRAKAGGLSH